MKLKLSIASVILLMLSTVVAAQQSSPSWEKWKLLIGDWKGEGNGQPGQGEGFFSFQPGLDGNILIRKNHTVFPETSISPSKIHDDLLIVYSQSGSASQEAIYFDNEGNTIKYKVAFSDNSIILTSDKIAGSPRFRFTYSMTNKDTVSMAFDMASPDSPDAFRTYLSGKAERVK